MERDSYFDGGAVSTSGLDAFRSYCYPVNTRHMFSVGSVHEG